MEIVIGAFIAGLIGFVTAFLIQNRQFRNEKTKDRAILKDLLETLKDDIDDYHKRLKELRNILIAKGYPREHFNLSNKDAIWPQIVKTIVFSRNRDVFGRINRMARRLSILNREIQTIQEIITHEISVSPKEYPELSKRRKIDYCVSLIDDVINRDIIERGANLDIQIKLEKIIGGM